MNRRICITGRGVLTCNATSVRDFADALRAGRSGIGPLTLLDPAPYYCHRAGEVRELVDDGCRPSGRIHHLLRAAVEQAVSEAGSAWLLDNSQQIGLVLGTTTGAGAAKEQLAERRVRPAECGDSELEQELLSQLSHDSCWMPIAQELGLGGPVLGTSVSCTSGGAAVGLAAALLDSDDAAAMIVAAGEAISPTAYGGFSAVRAMTHESCRPFDRDRDGMMIGEGAAALILEPAESALARGAPVYAEISGFGCCNDAYHSVTPHPNGEGLAESVVQALSMAGLQPDAVDVIFAHGTATLQNDAMERAAYSAVFGERLREIPVVAVKPLVGHTLGAAGVVELMACICALEGGFIPPTLNHRVPDEGCPLWLIQDQSVSREIRAALCCNAAFAGNNSAIVVGRAREPAGGAPS